MPCVLALSWEVSGKARKISTAFTKKHPAKAPVVSTGNTEVSEMSLRTSSFNFGFSSDMASLLKLFKNERYRGNKKLQPVYEKKNKTACD
jgi:hypothetical protein